MLKRSKEKRKPVNISFVKIDLNNGPNSLGEKAKLEKHESHFFASNATAIFRCRQIYLYRRTIVEWNAGTPKNSI